MLRSARQKVPPRPASRRVTARKQKTPDLPPPPPPPTEEERRVALTERHAALRHHLWPTSGSVLTTVGDVIIHCGSVTRGRPHWHLMTEGLANRGYELSVRVQKEKEELAAPGWAIHLLSTLIARAQEGQLSADTNQVMVLAQGVAPGTDSELFGVVFTADPEAPALVTAHDHLPLLLAVPVTRDEARAVREWSPPALVEVLGKVDPLLITLLDRPSLLQSPRARILIEQRMEKEGSSLSTMTASSSHASKTGEVVTWKLSVDGVDTLCSLLKGRIAHQRPFSVVSGASRVEVVNGDPAVAEFSKRALTLHLTLVAARQVRSLLKSKPGNYTFEQLPNFVLTVV
ncbi:MAG: suppressor of fused domain protein [Archangium sp.]|nr:suppressor of fused domain protein [Archangium sp.]MDP3155632.1 suppressor of fused domain protein [Archangium sp.]MDP3570762.1 suppressor of fused domain protein [Archangium sp.]